MKQYWEVKKDHFEKIVVFKVAGWYTMFYHDAFIAHRILELNWMGSKPMVSFPHRLTSYEKHINNLVENGFKVAVVDEIETSTDK